MSLVASAASADGLAVEVDLAPAGTEFARSGRA
jgi:hypothetical protein